MRSFYLSTYQILRQKFKQLGKGKKNANPEGFALVDQHKKNLTRFFVEHQKFIDLNFREIAHLSVFIFK